MPSEGWPDGFPLMPHPVEWVVGSVSTLVPLLAIGAIVLIWHRTRRPGVPASTSRAVLAAGHDPSRPPVRPVGQWNARVTQTGRLELTGDSGAIRIENGWLGFHAGGAATPTWIVPTSHVRAGKNSMLSQGEVWIESERTGRLNLTVSHEHINLVMQNDLKDMRERRYADEFLWLLHASGARVAA